MTSRKLKHFTKWHHGLLTKMPFDTMSSRQEGLAPNFIDPLIFLKCTTIKGIPLSKKTVKCREWRHDIRHNDIQHNDIQHNNWNIDESLFILMLGILMSPVIMLIVAMSVLTLSVIILIVIMLCDAMLNFIMLIWWHSA
jgi:hypothetical protein